MPERLYSTDRLAEAVRALAERATDPALRAQLHALAGTMENLDAQPSVPAEQQALEQAVDAALDASDEPGLVAAMRALGACERATIRPVDWSAASRG
jgi:hypothetical protein